jgi:MFS family permease
MDRTAENRSAGLFRIFGNRKYALYFSGQLISQVGTWMQIVALSWFTYKLTNSPFLLAVVGASSQLPSLLVMPVAGVFVDRWNRHKLVVTTQILSMVQAGLLAYVTLTNQVQVWHLIALGLFAGVINAFDMPTRSAFVFDLVDRKEDLPNAIAMNSSLMNVTRMIGPALAGFVVAAVGAGYCFLLNALSYIAVIIALWFIKGDFNPKGVSQSGVFKDLFQGFEYLKRTGPVRALILMLGVFGMGGMAYSLLLPVFVQSIGGNANTLGYLMAASAGGALCGTVLLARRSSILGLGKWVRASSFAFAAALLAFSFVHSFWPAVLTLMAIGFCMLIQMASVSTILQSIVDDDKRGRVMSFYSMAFLGSAPIGSLIGGALANHIGFHWTIFACGIYCLIVAASFHSQLPRLRSEGRPIYIQRGILVAEEEAKILRT